MLDKIQSKLKPHEGFLVTRKENRFYLSGFTGSGGYLLITSEKAYFFLDGKYIVQAREQTRDIEIIDLEGRDFISVLEKQISACSIRTLFFESAYVSYDFYLLLDTLSAELSPKSGVIEKIRTVKSPLEVELIKKSCTIAETAILKGLDSFKPGMTERELALTIEYNARLLGAEEIDFIIVASGENGSKPHIRPTHKVILPDEFITIDFGIVYRGYHSDITRTFTMEGVSKRLKKIYNIVWEAQKLGVSLVRSGVSTRSIDSEVREFIEKQGLGEYFVHGLGHDIGIDGHEEPLLNTTSDTILRKNMVVTIEPGIYIEGLGGVRIEDTLLVTEEGALSLTTLDREYKEIRDVK